MYIKKISSGLLAVLFSSALNIFVSLSPANAEMKGDRQAIALAEQLVESIGGAEIWAKARTFYAVEKSRSTLGDGIIGTFWRDLKEPREWYTLNTRSGNEYKFWWDARGAYQTINGKVNENLGEGVHDEVMDYWHGEIYIMYHRFAKEDESLRLEKEDDNSFTAYDDSLGGRRLGTFWINGDGDLYRWRHDDGTEYIYGPHREFGKISLPDWGTQVDGSWSFYYTEVRLLETEPPVSFEAPEKK